MTIGNKLVYICLSFASIYVVMKNLITHENEYIIKELEQVRLNNALVQVQRTIAVDKQDKIKIMKDIRQINKKSDIDELPVIDKVVDPVNIIAKRQGIMLVKHEKKEISAKTIVALEKAKLHSDKGSWVEVVKVLKNICRVMISPADCYHNLAIAYDQQGHIKSAIKNYRKAIDIAVTNNDVVMSKSLEDRLIYLTRKNNDRDATNTSRTDY